MNQASKGLSLVVILILAALSISLILPATNAQSSSKPVTPPFTVKYIKENETVVFTIQNQLFAPNTCSNGAYYFNFRYKSSYDNQWGYTQFGPNGTSVYKAGGFFTESLAYYKSLYAASDSNYTKITFNTHQFVTYNDASEFINGLQLDFQVQAQIGTIDWIEGSGSPSLGSLYKFVGESSDWSDTQTLTIFANEEPSPTPTIPEFSRQATLILLMSALLIATFLKRQKLTRKV